MIRTILVAVDGSARASGVFDAAVEIARAVRGHIVLFRAVSIPPDFGPAGLAGDPDALPEFLEREARTQLQALAEGAPDVPCEVRVDAAAQPWRAILAAAERVGADLIVLGSHGQSGWDHILGTIAGKVANLADRNVMVIHERGPRTRTTPVPPARG
jgi:nucleotide-binding universal stress UspA family protein